MEMVYKTHSLYFSNEKLAREVSEALKIMFMDTEKVETVEVDENKVDIVRKFSHLSLYAREKLKEYQRRRFYQMLEKIKYFLEDNEGVSEKEISDLKKLRTVIIESLSQDKENCTAPT